MDGDTIKQIPPPLDLCKKTPLERQIIKSTWLATKKVHQIPAIDTPVLVRKTPFGLSVPAIKAKCSPHTELLAMARNPLPQMHYVTRAEKEVQRELEEEMTKEELRWLKRKIYVPISTGVSKAALKAKITPRIETMAMAKLCEPEENCGISEKRKKRKRSVPSHFPLLEKSPFTRPRTPRVCGCAESIKRKFFSSQELVEYL